MNFFFPGCDSNDEAYSMYKSTLQWTIDRFGPIDPIRIYSIESKNEITTVGKICSRNLDEVCTILRNDKYYFICTNRNGVIFGTPIQIAVNEILNVVFFDE